MSKLTSPVGEKRHDKTPSPTNYGVFVAPAQTHQNVEQEPPVYFANVQYERTNMSTATNGDGIHRIPVRLNEIWDNYDDIPNTPPGALLNDGDTYVVGATTILKLIKDRALSQVGNLTNKFRLTASNDTDLLNVVPATMGMFAPTSGNVGATLSNPPQAATGYTPVIKDATGKLFNMQPSVWVVDGLNQLVEFPRGVPSTMKQPFTLTFIRYAGPVGGQTVVPPSGTHTWVYSTDAGDGNKDIFIPNKPPAYPDGKVANWMTGEQGASSSGTIVTSSAGQGTRIMFEVFNGGALRAGYVSGTQWDPANRGTGSVAFGTDNKASGAYSSIPGGSGNSTGSTGSFIGGGTSNSIVIADGVNAGYAFTLGGDTNIITQSGNGQSIVAAGAVGGSGNIVSSAGGTVTNCVVLGGSGNMIESAAGQSAANSVIVGGTGITALSNQANTTYCQILNQKGGYQIPVKDLVAGDSPYAATVNDYAFNADTSAGAITITLPASPVAGQLYHVKHYAGGASVTVSGNGKNIDDGAGGTTATLDLPDPGDFETFLWDSAYAAGAGIWLRLGKGLDVAVPAALQLYVSRDGNDASGDGTMSAPYLTIERALADAQRSGWRDTATVTILDTSGGSGPFQLPAGDASFNAGSRGAQRTPLVVAGEAPTVSAGSTVLTATATAGGLLQLQASAGVFVAGDVGKRVRFTSGSLSTYQLGGAFSGTIQVEVLIAKYVSADTVVLAFDGASTPAPGDAFSFVVNKTKTELTGAAKIRSDQNEVVFRDLDIAANPSGGQAGVAVFNTHVGTYGVNVTAAAATEFFIANVNAGWTAGLYADSQANGFVAATTSLFVDVSAAGSKFSTLSEFTSEKRTLSNMVVVGDPAGSPTDFLTSGILRSSYWKATGTLSPDDGGYLSIENLQIETSRGSDSALKATKSSAADATTVFIDSPIAGVAGLRVDEGGNFVVSGLTVTKSTSGEAVYVKNGRAELAGTLTLNLSGTVGTSSAAILVEENGRLVCLGTCTIGGGGAGTGSAGTGILARKGGEAHFMGAVTASFNGKHGIEVLQNGSVHVLGAVVASSNFNSGIHVELKGEYHSSSTVTANANTGSGTNSAVNNGINVEDLGQCSISGAITANDNAMGIRCTKSSTFSASSTIACTDNVYGVGAFDGGVFHGNGTVTLTGSSTIGLWVANGIAASNSTITVTGPSPAAGTGIDVRGSTLTTYGNIVESGHSAGMISISSVVSAADITVSSNTADGLQVLRTDLTVANLTVQHNAGIGINVGFASSVRVTGTVETSFVATNPHQVYNVYVQRGSTMSVDGNVNASGASSNDIYVLHGGNLIVLGNVTANDTDTVASGILVAQSSLVSIAGNVTTSNNKYRGVFVQDNSSFLADGTLTATGNLNAGVWLDANSKGSVVGAVTATGNSLQNIAIQDASSFYAGANVTVDASGTTANELLFVDDSSTVHIDGNLAASGSQTKNNVVVSEGSLLSVAGTTTASTSVASSGLSVKNGSDLVAVGTVTCAGNAGDGVSVDNRSTFVAVGAVSSTGSTGGAGVNANRGSFVEVGGTLTATGNNTQGVLVQNGSKMVADGAVSTTTCATGIEVRNASDLACTNAGVAVTVSDTGVACATGLLVSKGSRAFFAGTVTASFCSAAAGVAVSQNSSAVFDGATTASSNTTYGVHVSDGGSATLSSAGALTCATNTSGAVLVENKSELVLTGTATLSGAGNGLAVNHGSFAEVVGALTATGTGAASGVHVEGGSEVVARNTVTTSAYAAGIEAVFDGRVVCANAASTVTASTGGATCGTGITVTLGGGALFAGPVVSSSCTSASGIIIGDGAATAFNGTVTASSNTGNGVYVYEGATATFNGAVTASSNTSSGLLVTGGALAAAALGTTVTTNSNTTHGVFVDGGRFKGDAVVSNSNGASAHGVFVTNLGKLLAGAVSASLNGTGPSPGSGVVVSEKGEAKTGAITSPGGNNTSYGVQLSSGGTARVGSASTASGTSGDTKIGTNATATWATLAGKLPVDLTDYAAQGAPAAADICSISYL